MMQRLVYDPFHYQTYFLDYLADALWTAYFDQQELIAWADGLIGQSSAPRQWLINLSLCGQQPFPENGAHPWYTGEIYDDFPDWQEGYVRCNESFLWAKHVQGRLTAQELVVQYIDLSGNEDFYPAQLLKEMHKEAGRVAGFVTVMRKADLFLHLPHLFDLNAPTPRCVNY